MCSRVALCLRGASLLVCFDCISDILCMFAWFWIFVRSRPVFGAFRLLSLAFVVFSVCSIYNLDPLTCLNKYNLLLQDRIFRVTLWYLTTKIDYLISTVKRVDGLSFSSCIISFLYPTAVRFVYFSHDLCLVIFLKYIVCLWLKHVHVVKLVSISIVMKKQAIHFSTVHLRSSQS